MDFGIFATDLSTRKSHWIKEDGQILLFDSFIKAQKWVAKNPDPNVNHSIDPYYDLGVHA